MAVLNVSRRRRISVDANISGVTGRSRCREWLCLGLTSRGFHWPYGPPPRQRKVLPVRQTRNHDALVRLDAIPDAERELMHRRAAMVTRSGDDLILEGIVADAGEGSADLLDEAVAEALLARFVVVLGALDVRLSQRRDADRVAQGAG